MPEPVRVAVLVLAQDDHPLKAAVCAGLVTAGASVAHADQLVKGLMLISQGAAGETPSIVVVLGAISGLKPAVVAQAVRALPGATTLPLVLLGEAPSGWQRCAQLHPGVEAGRISQVTMSDPATWDTISHVPEVAAPAPQPTDPVVLIVDDNDVNLRLMQMQFEDLGLAMATCVDGQEAVDRVAAGGISLVFMDCQMPVLDGYAATREIRRREAGSGRHVPIIAVTAHVLPENRIACQEAGMDDFIAKPISRLDILSAVQNWLGGSRQPPAVPVASTHPIADEICDPSILWQLNQRAPGSARKIMCLALTGLREARASLTQMRVASDLTPLWRAAHKLKGGAGAVGADEVQRHCQVLETAARGGEHAVSARALDALLEALPRLDLRLVQLVASLG